MLVKLLKWELRSTAVRLSLAMLIYGCLCVGLPWLLFAISRGAAVLFTLLTFSLGLSALEVVATVMLFQHYHRSVYGGEGYMFFTLPVGMGRMLAAKLLTALLWLTAVDGLMAAGLVTAAKIIRSGAAAELFPAIRFPAASVPPMAVSSLIGAVNVLLIIYFSVTVSKLPLWRKAGAAAGILVFLVLYIGQTVLSLLGQGGMRQIVRQTTRTVGAAAVVDLGPYYSWRALWPGLILHTAVGAALFGATVRLLGRRTELK